MSKGRGASPAPRHPYQSHQPYRSSSSSSFGNEEGSGPSGSSSATPSSSHLRWAPHRANSGASAGASPSPNSMQRTTSAARSNRSNRQEHDPSGNSAAGSQPSGGGVFDRVVRKISKRVKPPSNGHGAGSRRGSNSASEPVPPASDPPSYTSATTGASTPRIQSPTANTHRRVVSRQELREREREREREQDQPRREIQEWGPPPLTDQRFQQTLAEQEAAAMRADNQPRRSGSISRRFDRRQQQERYKDRQRQRHQPSSSVQNTPPAAPYNTLASRSFDSLVAPGGASHDSTSGLLGHSSDADYVARLPSQSPPHYNTAAANAAPATTNAGASGLVRKTTISSTPRAKPAHETPVANPNSSTFPVGFWPPNARPTRDAQEPPVLTEEELHAREKERDELLGKGPYWSIQRGWNVGVVTNLEEANSRTRNFPGPVVRYFAADKLDDALEFSRIRPKPVPGAGQSSDEDDEAEMVKRASQTSIALGRSVSLMDGKSKSTVAQRQKRHPRGGQQSMSDARNLESSTTPTQTAPGDWNAASGGNASTTSNDRALAVPLLSAGPTGSSPKTRMTFVLYAQDLPSSVKFYSAIVGLQVLSHFPRQSATLALESQAPAETAIELRSGSSIFGNHTSCIRLQMTHDVGLLRLRFESLMRQHRAECERAAVEGVPVDGQNWEQVALVEQTATASEVVIRDPSSNLVIFTQQQQPGSAPSGGAAPVTNTSHSELTTSLRERMVEERNVVDVQGRSDDKRKDLGLRAPANLNTLPRRTLSPNNPFLRGGLSSPGPVSPAALPEAMNPFAIQNSAGPKSVPGISNEALEVMREEDGAGEERTSSRNPHLSLHLGSPFSAGGSFPTRLQDDHEVSGGMSTAESDATITAPSGSGSAGGTAWTRVQDESD